MPPADRCTTYPTSLTQPPNTFESPIEVSNHSESYRRILKFFLSTNNPWLESLPSWSRQLSIGWQFQTAACETLPIASSAPSIGAIFHREVLSIMHQIQIQWYMYTLSVCSFYHFRNRLMRILKQIQGKYCITIRQIKCRMLKNFGLCFLYEDIY